MAVSRFYFQTYVIQRIVKAALLYLGRDYIISSNEPKKIGIVKRQLQAT
jgi:hypothetical protein